MKIKHPAGEADLVLSGDWTISIADASGRRAFEQSLVISPPVKIVVESQKIAFLPVFDPAAGGWIKGAPLEQVRSQECTTCHSLEPSSLVVKDGAGPDAVVFERGRDYEADLAWGTVGRINTGRIAADQPVYVNYTCSNLRIDSIVCTRTGVIEVRRGEPHVAVPRLTELAQGETRLANIWVNGRLEALGDDNLFPIMEQPSTLQASGIAQQLLPNTLGKLRAGKTLKILAWGDSVTDGSYLPSSGTDRWQQQFVSLLLGRYKGADIRLATEAWPGRNTDSYLSEPPGAEHNYREKVLAVKPDLIISEFVNDAGLTAAQVDERYSMFLEDFRKIGAEWIILTPHYVRPDWMGLTREKGIDNDPRAYVTGLRAFSAAKGVALADASLGWGRLWRQGIPYTSYLHNCINHPDVRGMRIFADSLISLF